MKTILALDIGGIVFEPRWRIYGIPEVSKRFDVSEKELGLALNKEKKEFYTGKITEKMYWRSVSTRLDIKKEINFPKLYRQYVTVNKDVLTILNKLKKKYFLVACNNCPKEWMDYRVHLAHLQNYFSEFITSGYIGFMKPDVRIYQKLLELYPGRKIIYIDDNPDYVKAAESLDISTILFKKTNDLLSLL